MFISYAHVTDKPDGWVTQFKTELTKTLSSALDREAEVWFDTTWVKGGDEIRDRIGTDLRSTAILVPVLSPAYVRSEFCTLVELGSFLPNEIGRVVPVSRLPLEDGQVGPLPDDLKSLSFFRETETGCDQFDVSDDRFENAVRDLSRAIIYKLRQMRKSRQRIYVSQPGINDELLSRVRKSLREEFHGQGYTILPDQVIFPFMRQDQLRDQIRSWQEQCDVLLLLLHGEPDTLTEQQVSIAQTLGKSCVVAVRDLDSVAQPTEKKEPAVLLTAQGWREEIVRRVVSKLRPIAESAPSPNTRNIYLLCSPEDYDRSWELRKLILADIGPGAPLDVLLPEFSLRDPFKFQMDHENKLRSCEGLILFWGSAERNWFESQNQEVVPRAISWLREKKYIAEAKYLSAPERPDKLQVRPTRDEFVIRQFENPRIDDLRPFLAAIGPAREAE